MGQAISCFKGPECGVAVHKTASYDPDRLEAGPETGSRACTAANQPVQSKQQQQQLQHGETGGEQAQAATLAPGDAKSNAALACCCLGVASQPGSGYDVTASGPPLPGCETERLEQSHLGELLDLAPKDELQNILALVCNMFSVKNALVSLFFDRRVYIIDGTGAFTEGDFPWRYSMCGWTMASERHCVMIVNDVLQDARFCNSPVAKQYGVRFYVGAPLVSSAGHRLGTLCFADSQPRVFDDTSLKLLCNFSELVTRALERDIVVAHHQQMSRPGAALKELEHKHKYGMLLRSIDSLGSAVLLVDTATAGWVVRYVNSGWQSLVQRCQQSQATRAWVNAANTTAGSSSGPLPSVAADVAAATADADSTGANSAALPGNNSGMVVDSGLSVGWLLWPMVEQQLSRDADRGCGVVKQLQELLRKRTPFTLHGLEMAGLTGATVSLVCRPAGESEIDGSVSICVPTWVPPPDFVASSAAALQATAADHEMPNTTCAPWQTLYFVSVLLETPAQQSIRQLPGLAASSCGSFSIEQGRRGSAAGSQVAAHKGSGVVLSVPAAGQVQAGAARSVYDDANLMVLSSLSEHGYNVSRSSSSSSNVLANSSTFGSHCTSNVASLVGSCVTSIASGSAAAAARAVCRQIEGLHVGGLIASGSYGRVYRGDYYGCTVAVKVLESDAVLRREAVTGLCLEALLGEKLRHPNVVSTIAWAVVTGKHKLAVGSRLWGQTLDVGKPSIADNKAAIAAATHDDVQQQQQPGPRCLSSGAGSAARDSMEHLVSVSQHLPGLHEEEQANSSSSCCTGDSSLVTAETWLVLEYCNKGCLQDAIDRGWLRDGPDGSVSLAKVVVTATEVAAGMYALHRADVVHGDLSPYNVLLSSTQPAAAEAGRGFVAKISDFGLSRPMGGHSKKLTKTYGTITHMSPELLEHGVSSKAVDVYSFGVLLWQMLASSRAWAGLSHHGVVHCVCVQKLSLQFPPEAPDALVQLGQACMSYTPSDRPSFKDILDVLLPLSQYVGQNMKAD